MSNPDVKIPKFFLILSRTYPNYYFYKYNIIEIFLEFQAPVKNFLKWFLKFLKQFRDQLIKPFLNMSKKGGYGKLRRGVRFGLVGLVL